MFFFAHITDSLVKVYFSGGLIKIYGGGHETLADNIYTFSLICPSFLRRPAVSAEIPGRNRSKINV